MGNMSVSSFRQHLESHLFLGEVMCKGDEAERDYCFGLDFLGKKFKYCVDASRMGNYTRCGKV